MITPEYCRVMARYNAWQNRGLRTAAESLPEKELTKDRGAFFGSIHRTMNHLLWADLMWLSRFDAGEAPDGGIPESVDYTPTLATWWAERFRCDGQITAWAEDLSSLDLVGDLRWTSGVTGRVMQKSVGQCVAHFFNHQAHHRGQIHAMLTAAGAVPEPSDLAFMKDEV